MCRISRNAGLSIVVSRNCESPPWPLLPRGFRHVRTIFPANGSSDCQRHTLATMSGPLESGSPRTKSWRCHPKVPLSFLKVGRRPRAMSCGCARAVHRSQAAPGLMDSIPRPSTFERAKFALWRSGGLQREHHSKKNQAGLRHRRACWSVLAVHVSACGSTAMPMPLPRGESKDVRSTSPTAIHRESDSRNESCIAREC
jgi:hypothetical protein